MLRIITRSVSIKNRVLCYNAQSLKPKTKGKREEKWAKIRWIKNKIKKRW